jgi:hypothetical protein
MRVRRAFLLCMNWDFDNRSSTSGYNGSSRLSSLCDCLFPAMGFGYIDILHCVMVRLC